VATNGTITIIVTILLETIEKTTTENLTIDGEMEK